MNNAYLWWLLAVILAGAAAALWLMRGSLPRREVDVDDAERSAEARWIARQLRRTGHQVPADAIERALALHRTYLDEGMRAGRDAELIPEVAAEPAAAKASGEPVPGEPRPPASAQRQSRRDQSTKESKRRARRGQQPEVPPARFGESGSSG